jgi:hypothetical protein
LLGSLQQTTIEGKCHATVEELLQAVFPVRFVPRLHSKELLLKRKREKRKKNRKEKYNSKG